MFDIINALLLGFMYGLGPCTISCAPLIVPLIVSTAKDKRQGVIFSIIFSLGRVVSYTVLGFFSGLFGESFDLFIPQRGMGVLFIILGIAIMTKVKGKCLYKTSFRITGPFMSFAAGIVFGLGPCPPLLALLALAVLSNSAVTGALMGLVFGIGTIVSPVIILGLVSGWFAKQKEFKEVIPYVSGGFLLLWGIGYLIFG